MPMLVFGLLGRGRAFLIGGPWTLYRDKGDGLGETFLSALDGAVSLRI